MSGAIEPTLEAAEIRRALSLRTTDLTAYDLYLRVLPLVFSRGKDQINRALGLLRQAIERDPRYGPALALAAACRVYFHAGGWTVNPEANRREGLDLARQALRSADEDPCVLARSAYALGYFEQDIDPAIGLIERALELNLSCAPAWPISGWLRLWAGQPDRAMHDFEMYQRLRGPRATIHPGIGVAYLFSRRFEEARKSLQLSLEDFSSWVPTYRFLACCYALMGRLEEAREIVERLRALTPVVVPSANNWRNPADRELLLSGLRLACAPPGSTMINAVAFSRSRAGGRDRRRPSGLAQSGERNLAVLLADIRGFTALYHAKPPSDILLILNRYYAVMGNVVERSGGQVGRFVGDSVTAYFGIAGQTQTGCCQALAAARLMSIRLAELNASLRGTLSKPLQIGIGIHAGPVVIGMTGYGDVTSLTAIGDAVDTANRLEGLTNEFKCELIVSDEVLARAGLDRSIFCWRQIDLAGRGRQLMVAIIDRAGDLPLVSVPPFEIASLHSQ